jgi:EAL domain-containing protein (putative c-di-GMP-specific phosphodiesterase class I)
MQTRFGSERWDVDEIIKRRAVRTVFQPIVHIDSGGVVGFEALARGPVGSPLESAPALFDAARARGRLAELDWLCRVLAMGTASTKQMPPDLTWFFNVEPAALSTACPEDLIPTLARARLNLRVVLEIVERDTDTCVGPLLQATDQARQDQWGIALDDVDRMSLALLPLVQPDVVKLNASLWPASDREAARIVAASCSYAERRGAVVVVEGIESAEQEALARAHGVTYGQGFRYGRPGELPAVVPQSPRVIPLKQRPKPLSSLTPFELVSADQLPRPISRDGLLGLSCHLEQLARNDAETDVLLACLPIGHVPPEVELRFRELSRQNELTVIVGDRVHAETGQRPHARPFPLANTTTSDWMVIVLGAHSAAALVAREMEGGGAGSNREFEFVLTYDQALVAAAGRAFLSEFGPRPDEHSADQISRIVPAVG